MDEEFKQRLIDYFDPYELVALIGVTTEEIVEAFIEAIEVREDELREFMTYGD